MNYSRDLERMLSELKTVPRLANVDKVMVEAMLSNGYSIETMVNGPSDWYNYVHFEVWVSMCMYILTLHAQMLPTVLRKLDAVIFFQTEQIVTNPEELETFDTWTELLYINTRVLASCTNPIKYLRAHPIINQYLDRAIQAATISNLDQFLTLQTVNSDGEVYLKEGTLEQIITRCGFMPIITRLALHWI